MGNYEDYGTKAIESNELNFSGNNETAVLSLKVLDTLSENAPELPVKYALTVLDDAKDMLLQLLSV